MKYGDYNSELVKDFNRVVAIDLGVCEHRGHVSGQELQSDDSTK